MLVFRKILRKCYVNDSRVFFWGPNFGVLIEFEIVSDFSKVLYKVKVVIYKVNLRVRIRG